MTETARRAVAALIATLVGLALLPMLAAPAHAADYYRYWGVFELQGDTWTPSQEGAGTLQPDDGSMLGFRFAAPDAKTPNVPRNDPAAVDFDTVCGDTEAEDGSKRVAVVIDYGAEEDAEGQALPDNQAGCALIDQTGTALQALDSVADTRTEDSGSMGKLLCGIAGYPTAGCASEVVSTATPADDGFVEFAIDGASAGAGESSDQSADQPGDDSGADTGAESAGAGTQTLLYVGLGLLVIVLLLGGLLIGRRRGSSDHR